MLERSSAAKYALTVFHENYNDFDIYIEDTATGYQKIFASLLSTAMGGNITLERVYPLGSRISVLNAAKHERSLGEIRRSAIYLVDGDLYLLSGETEELGDNVIVLPRYCIENFLIEEDTLLSIMDDEAHSTSIDVLKEQFDYFGWMERSKKSLQELFIVFAIAHKLKSGIPTVNRGYSCICADEQGEVHPDKAEKICKEILDQLTSQFNHERVTDVRDEIEQTIDQSLCFVTTYVSAKDFTLPLLMLRLRKITNTKATNLNLKLRFSRLCSMESLETVAQAIYKVINANSPPTLIK